MDRSERLAAHQNLVIPAGYLPNPSSHLYGPRDMSIFRWMCNAMQAGQCHSMLDVGCWDGWLDFLMIERGFEVTGVELVPELVTAAKQYATLNHVDYTVYRGFFDELEIIGRYDAVAALEMLEHVALDEVPAYVAKMESLAVKKVFIALPDQDCSKNGQHLWTPTEELIKEMWGARRDFVCQRWCYSPSIPDNWMISWSTEPR